MQQELIHELEHPALVYDDVDEFLDYLLPFVQTGLENGEPVFVSVGAVELAALRKELGAGGTGLTLTDTREWHPASSTRLRAFYEFVKAQLAAGAERVRLVGEPAWPAGPPELVREWARYESVLNDVLGPFPVTLVCTYPTSRLEPSIVEDAARTHPVVRRVTEQASTLFEAPPELLRRWNPELAPIPPGAVSIREPTDLAAARAFVRDEALRAGLGDERSMALCIAANEVLANAYVHGGGSVTLSTWREDDRLLCQIDDHGTGISDSLAGYRPAHDSVEGGRGLWLARQLVDLLQIVPDATGTKVRLHVNCPQTA